LGVFGWSLTSVMSPAPLLGLRLQTQRDDSASGSPI
jgi:hypothetical protein